jgi:hypothetical protein
VETGRDNNRGGNIEDSFLFHSQEIVAIQVNIMSSQRRNRDSKIIIILFRWKIS